MTPDELEAYLFELARSEQSRPFGTYERCANCQHAWHGLACIADVTAIGGGHSLCMCPGGAT